MTKLYIILLTLFATGCTSYGAVTNTVTHGVQGNPVTTTTSMSSSDFRVKQEAETNQSIANANGKCWDAQYRYTMGERSWVPAGMTSDQYLVKEAINALKEVALSQQNHNQFSPCPVMTNSHDVAIVKEQEKTKRTATRWGVVTPVAKVIGGTILGDKVIDGVVGIASTGIGAAGNRSYITGDGNRTNTSSQKADTNSTVNDSGNQPLNQTLESFNNKAE